MAGKPRVFADEPTAREHERLEDVWRHGGSHWLRCRAHAVLLSAAGHSLEQLCEVFRVSRPTATAWVERWNTRRLDGLEDAPRAPRPGVLDEDETLVAIELLVDHPRQPKRVLDELERRTGKRPSRRTLRRIARGAGLSWKRARRSTHPPPDEAAVAQAELDLCALSARQGRGEVDLYALDEARFTLEPAVPYAWQPVGERLELPSGRGGGVSALAFVSTEGRVVPYTLEETVDGPTVVAAADDFSKGLERETWVVLDNASPHTSDEFAANEARWAEQGLHFYFLPPRSPELNWVEALWDRVRHQWLPLDATTSLARLRHCVDDVLASVGSLFHYNPADPCHI